ncbi:class I SAM-dependent methyltransferase [Amylibacter sp.]|nr:class I SAM-dependent methyltransferase [Amylibacter sp.]
MKFGISDYFKMYKKRDIRLPINYFLQNHLFDLLNGTDTHTWLPKENFDTKPKNFEFGVLYMSSWTSIVRESTLKAANIFSIKEPDLKLVDVGCGKGKVLCIWGKMFPQSRQVIGVEYSKELYEICVANLNKIGVSNIRVFCSDALDEQIDLENDFTIFYLFNPFDRSIIEQFIARLNNIKAIIIYNNPVHSDILLQHGFNEYFSRDGWHPNAVYKIMANFSV